jgi:hypothetical protein
MRILSGIACSAALLLVGCIQIPAAPESSLARDLGNLPDSAPRDTGNLPDSAPRDTGNLPDGVQTDDLRPPDAGSDTTLPWDLSDDGSGAIEGQVVLAPADAIPPQPEWPRIVVEGPLLAEARETLAPNGSFRLRDLPAGAGYRVTARCPGFGERSIDGLVVRSGQITRPSDIALDALPGRVSGMVSLEGGASPEGTQIAIAGSEQSTSANAEGRFTIEEVPAGAHSIRASLQGHAEVGLEFTLYPEQNMELPPLLLALGRAELGGRVRLSGRARHEGTRVRVQSASSTAETTSQADGSFSVLDLPVGIYSLTFEHSGYASQRVDGLELVAGRRTAVPDLELLPAPALVQGWVRRHGMGAAGNAGVELTLGAPDCRATSAADGSFVLGGEGCVPPGAHRLSATCPGFLAASLQFDAPPGGTVMLQALYLLPDADGDGRAPERWGGALGTDCDDSAASCILDCSDTDGDALPDCNDTCVDLDGDGYGPQPGCLGPDCMPESSVCNEDCSDRDGDETVDCLDDCVDQDADGICANVDCDDRAPLCALDCLADLDGDGLRDCEDDCVDRDGDGLGSGPACAGADCLDDPALGGENCGGDCRDADADGRPDCADDCIDRDGDGYGNGRGCIDSDCLDEAGRGAACHSNCAAGDLASTDCCRDVDGDATPDCVDGCIDRDRDGYGDPQASRDAARNPPSCAHTDCAEGDAARHPGRTETCDRIDNNCDGRTDENCACIQGQTRACGSNVGTCRQGTETCDLQGRWGSCVGSQGPVAETCDRADNDCDGSVDEGEPCAGSQFCSAGTCRSKCERPVSSIQVQFCDTCDGTDPQVVFHLAAITPNGSVQDYFRESSDTEYVGCQNARGAPVSLGSLTPALLQRTQRMYATGEERDFCFRLMRMTVRTYYGNSFTLERAGTCAGSDCGANAHCIGEGNCRTFNFGWSGSVQCY